MGMDEFNKVWTAFLLCINGMDSADDSLKLFPKAYAWKGSAGITKEDLLNCLCEDDYPLLMEPEITMEQSPPSGTMGVGRAELSKYVFYDQWDGDACTDEGKEQIRDFCAKVLAAIGKRLVEKGQSGELKHPHTKQVIVAALA